MKLYTWKKKYFSRYWAYYKVLVLIYKIQFVHDLKPINFHQGGIYSDAVEPMDV